MKLAILGATGKTGGHAMRRALEAGHSVRVLVRDPSKITTKHERVEVVKGDATNIEDCAKLVEGCDAVIGTLGPPNLGVTTGAGLMRSTRDVIARCKSNDGDAHVFSVSVALRWAGGFELVVLPRYEQVQPFCP